MRSITLIFILIIGFVSCSKKRSFNENETIYNLDIRSALGTEKQLIKLSEFAEKITYIPLETNSNCLLKKISYLHLTKDYIFVSDTRGLYQFDMKGNFVRQISTLGNGPKEHGKRIRFRADELNSEIYIFSYPNKILVNSLETGEFIRSFRVKFEVADFEISADGSLVFFTKEFNHILNQSLSEIFVVDKFGNVHDSISNQNRKKNRNNVIGYVHTYKSKQDIMFMGTYKDKLYKLTASKKKENYAAFHLDNNVNWEKLIIEPQMGNRMDNFLNIVKILETSDFLFVTVHEGIRSPGKVPLKHQILYQKKSNEVLYTEELVNDVDNGPSFWPSFVVNGKLVGYYLPLQLIKDKDENANQFSFEESNGFSIKTISKNDNPIIAIVE